MNISVLKYKYSNRYCQTKLEKISDLMEGIIARRTDRHNVNKMNIINSWSGNKDYCEKCKC